LLAACRDSWPETSNQIEITRRLFDQLQSLSVSRGEPASGQGWIRKTLDDLNRVHALSANLRQDPRVKAELVATVLETVTARTTPETAARIVDALSGGLSGEFLQQENESAVTVRRLLEDLQFLGAGLRRFDADSLRTRFETGLDRELQPAEVEEPLAKKIRKLFDQLKNDDELSRMIGLARNLMAIVDLPRPLQEPDEIPVGGVSDIANRGTLDRLLISELAQDDQTLMLRLAMNEALYLRREVPLHNPPRSRLLVVDAGLRLWGIPRVFATSVALSMAAICGTSVDLRVLRPEGDRLQPVDLSTREGLIDHLKVLRSEAHPGRALADLSRRAAECGTEVDTVLITGDDVAADREFRRQLAECEENVAFLITVSRGGDFRLWQRTLHGTKLLRNATLKVENLLKPASRPAVPLIDPARRPDLPAILNVTPFPLRLSHHVNPQQTWWVRHNGVLSVTNDQRLMHWDRPLLGGRQIADRLPARRVLWCQGFADNGRTRFVVGSPDKPALWMVTADLENGGCQVVPFAATESPVRCVCDHAGALFVVQKREILVCDLHSGEHLQTLTIPADLRWSNARFFRRYSSWSALSYDGTQARFEKIPSFEPIPQSEWQYVNILIDVKGVQGPVGLSSKDGSLYFTAERTHIPLQQPLASPIEVRAIGRDGHRLCIEHGGTGTQSRRETVLVNTMDRTVRPVRGEPTEIVEPNYREVVRPASLRTHFLSVGADQSRLVLESRHHEFRCLAIDVAQDRLLLSLLPGSDEIRSRMRRFEPAIGPPGVKYRLSVATFPDGSQVFLDSRGLLHLKSANRQIPEASFVLSTNYLAGWCADGRTWGPRYFLGRTSQVSSRDIWASLLVPFMR
jgi:hypothetical protein